MAVPVEVKIRGYLITIQVERWKCIDGFEYFHIIGNDRTVSIKCNRPIIVDKGLKHFPITWTLHEGEMTTDSVFKIGKAIEKQDWFPVRTVEPGRKK